MTTKILSNRRKQASTKYNPFYIIDEWKPPHHTQSSLSYNVIHKPKGAKM